MGPNYSFYQHSHDNSFWITEIEAFCSDESSKCKTLSCSLIYSYIWRVTVRIEMGEIKAHSHFFFDNPFLVGIPIWLYIVLSTWNHSHTTYLLPILFNERRKNCWDCLLEYLLSSDAFIYIMRISGKFYIQSSTNFPVSVSLNVLHQFPIRFQFIYYFIY